MEDNEEEVEDVIDEVEEERDLSMVLALLIRSGQVRFNQGVYRRFGFMDPAPESDDDIDDNDDNSNLEEPDTMKESDLMHEILLRTGKLSSVSKNSNINQNNIISLLQKREIRCCGIKRKNVFTSGCQTAICSPRLPNKVVRTVQLQEKLFCGIYSEDGNTFLSACQDGRLRLFNANHFEDTSKHCLPFKNIPAIDVGWSILDIAFSPDSLYLAYSTWSSDLHIASIYDNEDESLCSHTRMDLRPENYNFAAFSLQFSGDNNEVLCGANDGHLYIYDRHLGVRTSRISAHEDDVNAIRFADKSSQILYSGGDDGLVNVWDRRMLHENSPQKVGSFAGHIDGITFIDSKEDTRYLLSNSKDQTIKVWDVRKFSSVDAQKAVKKAVSHQGWDYRWQHIPRRQIDRKKTVAGDTSIKTYHGHEVTNTLIRARFSPMHSTGQKYIYCGCSSGNVIIYDIVTGEIVSKIQKHKKAVRDVHWHPYEPKFVSSSWDGSFCVWNHHVADIDESVEQKQCKKQKMEFKYSHDRNDNRGLRRSPRLARSSETGEHTSY